MTPRDVRLRRMSDSAGCQTPQVVRLRGMSDSEGVAHDPGGVNNHIKMCWFLKTAKSSLLLHPNPVFKYICCV